MDFPIQIIFFSILGGPSDEHVNVIQTDVKAVNKENASVPVKHFGQCQYYLQERMMNLDESSSSNRQYSAKKVLN